MPHRMLSIQQAAGRLQVPVEELRHLVKRDAVPHHKRGDEIVFVNREIESWASRRLLSLHGRHLADHHAQSTREQNRIAADDFMIRRLCRPEWCSLELRAKTRPGVLRDMAALAGSTGMLYDESDLFRQISEREADHPTAIEGGIALLHPRNHDPYLMAESFLVFARSSTPVFFGAPDDRPTDLFFLFCCQEDALHLHVLARLCSLVRDPTLSDALRQTETAADAYGVLDAAETGLLKNLPSFRQ